MLFFFLFIGIGYFCKIKVDSAFYSFLSLFFPFQRGWAREIFPSKTLVKCSRNFRSPTIATESNAFLLIFFSSFFFFEYTFLLFPLIRFKISNFCKNFIMLKFFAASTKEKIFPSQVLKFLLLQEIFFMLLTILCPFRIKPVFS